MILYINVNCWSSPLKNDLHGSHFLISICNKLITHKNDVTWNVRWIPCDHNHRWRATTFTHCLMHVHVFTEPLLWLWFNATQRPQFQPPKDWQERTMSHRVDFITSHRWFPQHVYHQKFHTLVLSLPLSIRCKEQTKETC
jgi:hypothetical protein